MLQPDSWRTAVNPDAAHLECVNVVTNLLWLGKSQCVHFEKSEIIIQMDILFFAYFRKARFLLCRNVNITFWKMDIRQKHSVHKMSCMQALSTEVLWLLLTLHSTSDLHVQRGKDKWEKVVLSSYSHCFDVMLGTSVSWWFGLSPDLMMLHCVYICSP